MSIVARCGSVALLVGLLVGVTAVARSAPEASGGWTDPPVRGAAGPAVKPSAPAAQAPAAQAPVAKPERAAAAPVRRSPVTAQPIPRQARVVATRRPPAPIRRFAVRSQSVAASVARPTWRARLRVAAYPRHRFAERAVRASRRHYAERMPFMYAPEPPNYARRAGWGGLVDDDSAYRVAYARAAGYRVMRLRTYVLPDGGQVQQLSPLEPDGLD